MQFKVNILYSLRDMRQNGGLPICSYFMFLRSLRNRRVFVSPVSRSFSVPLFGEKHVVSEL